MTTVKNFFYYFFQPIPMDEFSYYIPTIIFIALLICGTIAFSIIYNKKKKTDFVFKKLFKNIGKRMILIAILLTCYLLVRYENIPYFSMRIWLYITMGLFIFFAYRYAKKYLKVYPKEKINFEMNHSVKITGKSYLPNKK
ncbi:MAG: hypothetical protein PHP74_00395 [Candidatus Gracilibacteria bacterium]|nr:hypothetical protein [Candidatus Gracilibacteria bacterium]